MNQYTECTKCSEVTTLGSYHQCNTDDSVSLALNSDLPEHDVFSSVSTITPSSYSFLQKPNCNVYGVSYEKIIEKLEDEISGYQRTVDSIQSKYEEERNEKLAEQKKSDQLKRKCLKLETENRNLGLDLKISESVKRNLLDRLNKS